VLGINHDGTTCYHVLNVKASYKLWDIPDGQRIVCEYNPTSQPVGQSTSKVRWMTSLIIRSGNYIRISDEWKDVLECTKEDIWDALMVYLN
jgi:hypothetical protein